MKRGPLKGREEQYAEVRQLKASGMSNLAISRSTGVPPNTVTRWCPEYVHQRQHPYKPDELCEDDPGNSILEIELFETLVAKMIAGDPPAPAPVVGQMLEKLGKLRKDWQASQIRSGRLLSREAAMRFANSLVTLICEHFKDSPGFAENMDKVLVGLAALGPLNTRKEVNDLIG